MTDEVALGGWNVSGAVRVGDTVRRRTGAWTPTIHALLRHLAARGFDGAPHLLGIDEQGREILQFIAGESPSAYPYPNWVWLDQALRTAARLLRRYHDTVRSFRPPEPATWRVPLPPGPYEVVCHGDIAPANTVFRGHAAVAMIDWDHACPGPVAWDLAGALRRWAPLELPEFGRWTLSQRRERVRRFCEEYGYQDVRGVIALVPTLIRHIHGHIRDRALAGEPGFTDIWAINRGEGILRNAEWVERNAAQFA